MSEPIHEELEFSDRDKEELDKMLAEGADTAPDFHTVLEVWREVLRPAADLADEKVTPQYASKMVASYGGITFGDMEELQRRYYFKINDLLQILIAEIATDEECLTYTKPEEDAEHNSAHYKQLLIDWQLRFLQWELDWDTNSRDAAVELAAISEVHKMFFSQTGITAYLDNIRFEFTEADQNDLAAALSELRDAEAVTSE
jgi:hypothetical protein